MPGIKSTKAPIPLQLVDDATDAAVLVEKECDRMQGDLQRMVERLRMLRSTYRAYHPEATDQPVFPMRDVGEVGEFADVSYQSAEHHAHLLTVLLEDALVPMIDANGDRWQPRLVIVYDPA